MEYWENIAREYNVKFKDTHKIYAFHQNETLSKNKKFSFQIFSKRIFFIRPTNAFERRKIKLFKKIEIAES